MPCFASRAVATARQVENIVEGTKTVSVTLNFTKDRIITNVNTPLVLVHRIQLPILERIGASYELLVSATKNIHEEVQKMDTNEIPTKKQFTPPRPQLPMQPLMPAAPVSPPPTTASASSSKRPIDNDELASLRASVTHLTAMMTDMLEREAKRQATAQFPGYPAGYQ